MNRDRKGSFNFSFLVGRLMGRECVSESERGCGGRAGKGGSALSMEGAIYRKRNGKQGRAEEETGGREEAAV